MRQRLLYKPTMKFHSRYSFITLISIILCTNISSGINVFAYNQQVLLTPEPILTSPLKVFSIKKEPNKLLLKSIYTGDSLFISGDLTKAESAYKDGLQAVESLKIPWYNVILYNRIGYVNYWLLDIDESLEYYAQSLMIIHSQPIILDSLAYLEAFTYISINSRYNKEYSVHVKSDADRINIISNETFKNPVRKLKFHLLRTYLMINESRFDEFDTEMKLAEPLLKDLPSRNKFWPFLMRFYQGHYYRLLRDHNLAIRYLNELEHQVMHEKELRDFKYFVYICLLELNNNLHRYQAAAECIKQLTPYLENQLHPFFYIDYVKIGEVYKELGLFEEALHYFKTAEKIILEHGIQDEKLVYIYYYLAMYYKEIEWDMDMMLKYLHMAENIMNQFSDPYLESFIVYELGKYYYQKQEYDLAIIIFNLVLDDLDRLISDEQYFKSKYPHLARTPYLTILDYCAASFYYLSEQKNFEMVSLKHSYENYKQLVLLYEKMFRERGFEESKIATLKGVRKAFENLFEVGFTLYQRTKNNSYLNELFTYSERSKAYMLKNIVSDELAKRAGGVPENLINKARIIKKEIDSMQYSLSQNIPQSNNALDELLVSRILHKQEEYEDFIRKLENQYLDYALLKKQGKNISIENIQNQLKLDQALLEYFFIYNALYVFYIDKDTVYLTSQSINRGFSQQLLEYRSLFDNLSFNEFSEENIMDFIKQSHTLYTLAIKPVENLIDTKRLIIVPDEELSLIPFETLVSKHPDSLMQTPYNNLPYLVLSNPISYIYSASQLTTGKKSRFRNVDFAGFAPEYLTMSTDFNHIENGRLTSLPGAKDEVLSAKKYFRGRVYTNGHVCKDKYFKESQQRKIVHLAMHAVLDSLEPMNSWFVFSIQNQNPEGRLHAYEIYAHKIASSLVVLSACNTGMGRINKGEGVFSIARAYLLSGVKNVIYTQWSVADRSSAQLMDRFYFYLSQGIPTDIALQKAKIDFIIKGDPVKAFPFYWSPYVIMGTPIEIAPQRRIYIGIGLFLLVILITYVIWKKR